MSAGKDDYLVDLFVEFTLEHLLAGNISKYLEYCVYIFPDDDGIFDKKIIELAKEQKQDIGLVERRMKAAKMLERNLYE